MYSKSVKTMSARVLCVWLPLPICLIPPEARLPTLHVYCVKLFDILHIIYKQSIRNALTISSMEIDLAKTISFGLPFFIEASMVWKIHAISHDTDFKWNCDGLVEWGRGMHKQRMHIICPRIKIFRFSLVACNMDNWKTCTKCLYTIYNSTMFNIYYRTHIIIINTELHHSHSQIHAISIHSACFYVIFIALHTF